MSLDTFRFLNMFRMTSVNFTCFDFEHRRPSRQLNLLRLLENCPHRLHFAQFLIVKGLESHHQLDVVVQIDRVILDQLLHELPITRNSSNPNLPIAYSNQKVPDLAL